MIVAMPAYLMIALLFTAWISLSMSWSTSRNNGHSRHNIIITKRNSQEFMTRTITITRKSAAATARTTKLCLYARKRQQQDYDEYSQSTSSSSSLSSSSSSRHNVYNNYLELLLRDHGLDQRLIRLLPEQLPVFAEFQNDGRAQICKIQEIQFPSVKDDEDCTAKPTTTKKKNHFPKLKLELPDGSFQIADLGQITTIWNENNNNDNHVENRLKKIKKQQQQQGEIKSQSIIRLSDIVFQNDSNSIEESSWPVGHIDSILDQLWRTRSHTSPTSGSGSGNSSGSGGLSKKQISKLVAETPRDLFEESTVDQILRQIVKAGKGYSRLVDSEDVRWALFTPKTLPSSSSSSSSFQHDLLLLQRRAYSANVLSDDAKEGGRFKRFGCIPLPLPLSISPTDSVNDDGSAQSISIINGGWLASDQSVRATSEARKFSERADAGSVTLADERIIHRLERFAMEKSFFNNNNRKNRDSRNDIVDEKALEVDVRETLKTMELPLSPEGAREALIRIGRWTEAEDKNTKQTAVLAWSKPVLDAAEWYSQMDKQRRTRMYNAIREKNIDNSNISNHHGQMEGRVDLTNFPSICVDAARASFRDDAMSVRPRVSTGRKFDPEASKWEILLHISDVSDIYSPEPPTNVIDSIGNLKILNQAAAGRAVSRYDLPSGPLHLLPPVALESLALETINPDLTINKAIHQSKNDVQKKSVNRCVTLWVYIDERSGKILDAGVERTIISCPVALSFDSATRILDGSLQNDAIPDLKKARAVLGIVERNVGLWREYHSNQDEASQAREKRLAARELVGRHAYGGNANKKRRDDGQKGFVRTRGHQTVDACLELYGYAVTNLLQRKKAALPRVSGTGPERLGRVATAPLRRFVDGIAQRQALAVLCGYGGEPLTKQECTQIGKEVTRVINSINNLDTRKPGRREMGGIVPSQQKSAIKALQLHLANKRKLVPAIGTGRQNEVVILGVGTVASCKGVRGTLKPGEKVIVKVTKIDEEKGSVSAEFVRSFGVKSES